MTETLRTLPDQQGCEELMNRDAASIDLRDSARLGTVYVDGLIEDDFTSRGVKRALRDPADVWMQVVRRTVTGFGCPRS